ncbi:MAG: DUF2461 domain-containing protein [Devosia nanyangense]|uniref:DUF2461 domain-containing protein n=1 Tax=Devosia nanyangense TaxID=1228055 RepID=A0A933NWJ5_9HYPH|nr:DUF2461 domain-containing protein [Devosia nanyangense]
MAGFTGFPKETLAFLEGIAAHNEKPWFEAHRDVYEAGYVAPARAFVEAIGPKLRAISPAVQFEPKVNGSMSRINRDIRFSKDKRPYKDHLDLWFWHGERKGWACPGFWFRLTAKEVYLGTGMHGFEKEQLEAFRQSIVHPRSGKALLAAIASVRAKGDYEIGGKSRKLLPRGFETDADRAEYLLYEGLYASATLPIKAAAKPGFADLCLAHFANTWPIGQWLLDEVAGA